MTPPLLVDGSGFVHRAFHAFPPLVDPRQRPVGALYGFVRLLLPLLEKNPRVYVFFDAGRQTFRHKLYAGYKASRAPTDPDLVVQFPWIRAFCEAFGVPYCEHLDFEADDLIASAATRFSARGENCTIVSIDKDLCQMISPSIALYDPVKKASVTREEVLRRYGVFPEKMVSFQALVGDPSDCVPGVPGVGPKKAMELLQPYDSLEDLYAHLHELPPPRRALLEGHREQAFLSRDLVSLRRDINLPDFPVDRTFDISAARAFLEEFSFSTLLSTLDRLAPPLSAA
ncbi:MAG: hypothetical protein LBJ70_01460 [Holosporales bacterium]|jgi:DNA polymerase-1|nr:hypothetical protein [Holosporales bacterium]